MRYRMTFLTGLAVGYVLGAKAGRQRYEQIMRLARQVAGRPEVQRFAEMAKAETSDLVGAAKRTVTQRVGGHDVTDDVRVGVRV